MNVTVLFLKPHIHGGVMYPAGVRIALPEADAAWIVRAGVGNVLMNGEDCARPVSNPARPSSARRTRRSQQNG
ncbi:MAG: hypothetical protein LBI92_06850 [Azoarcus sp.]|jgi:hypothetical protein|nr:hypothetical protein [Azoarcus sp.]